MADPQIIRIDPLSARSLIIETSVKGQSLGTATGFVVDAKGKQLLITNWHVLAGRNSETNQLLSPTGATPDTVHILHHVAGNIGSWASRSETLYDNAGKPKWIEHPLGRTVDVVGLPLNNLHPSVAIYPFDLTLAHTDMIPQVAMPVSIIGYPFGIGTAGAWPIWKTGHIASDPDLDYGNRPAFLIDATTRGGMSGSPVVLRLTGRYETRSGSFLISSSGASTLFLGVYSGRIHEQSEIGRVWRPSVVDDIVAKA